MRPNWRAMFRWFDAGGYDVDIPKLHSQWGARMTPLSSLTVTADWTARLRSGTCGKRASGGE